MSADIEKVELEKVEVQKMPALHPETTNLTYRKPSSYAALDPVEQPEEDDDDKPASPQVRTKDLTPFAPLDIPMKYRLVALVTILFYTTGAAFAESTLGPLKSTFVKELHINSESTCPTHSNLCDRFLRPKDRRCQRQPSRC